MKEPRSSQNTATAQPAVHSGRPVAQKTTLAMPAFPQPGGTVRSSKWSYLIGDRIGSGAFGTVFECIGPFDQSFALKVYHPANRHHAQVRDDWLKEASRLYTLRHPNIVYVHDYFESGGCFTSCSNGVTTASTTCSAPQ